MNAKLAGRSASALGLPGLQEKQRVKSALDLGISLLMNKLLQLLGRLGNLGKVVYDGRELFAPLPPKLHSDSLHLVLHSNSILLHLRALPFGRALFYFGSERIRIRSTNCFPVSAAVHA